MQQLFETILLQDQRNIEDVALSPVKLRNSKRNILSLV